MRDYEKYHYITVGIPRDAEVFASLQEEARSYDVSLPKFLSMLLIDRGLALQGKGQSIWFPRGTAQPMDITSQEEELVSDTLQMRALAAASAWDD